MISPAQLSGPMELITAEFSARSVVSPRMPRVNHGSLKPLLKTRLLRKTQIACDERNHFAEDFTLYVRCLTKGACWWLLPGPMQDYASHPGPLTQQQNSHGLLRVRQIEPELLADPKVTQDLALVKAIRRHKAVLDCC